MKHEDEVFKTIINEILLVCNCIDLERKQEGITH
uniref:Transcriptional regulator n=1 Tax=Heterorhabditis bacteriophora TaxID=37862 RepID=A0A1I7WRJ2_HETBA